MTSGQAVALRRIINMLMAAAVPALLLSLGEDNLLRSDAEIWARLALIWGLRLMVAGCLVAAATQVRAALGWTRA